MTAGLEGLFGIDIGKQFGLHPLFAADLKNQIPFPVTMLSNDRKFPLPALRQKLDGLLQRLRGIGKGGGKSRKRAVEQHQRSTFFLKLFTDFSGQRPRHATEQAIHLLSQQLFETCVRRIVSLLRNRQNQPVTGLRQLPHHQVNHSVVKRVQYAGGDHADGASLSPGQRASGIVGAVSKFPNRRVNPCLRFRRELLCQRPAVQVE